MKRTVLSALLALGSLWQHTIAVGQAPALNGAIAGVVMGADEQRPARRAVVTVSGASDRINRAAITDDDGRFTVEDLPPGRLTVRVSKPAHLWLPDTPSGDLQIDLSPGQALDGITLWLRKGAALSGVVTDRYGLPVPGARVNLLRASARRGFTALPTSTTTDDRGYYRFFGLHAGEYLVSALQNPVLRSAIGAPTTADLDALLSALTTGSQVQRAARSVAERRVTLAPVFYPSALDPSVAGSVVLRYGDDRLNVDIGLVPAIPAAVEGRIQVPHGASGEVSLTLVRQGHDWSAADHTARPSRDGDFQFRGVNPGTYDIHARVASARTNASAPFEGVALWARETVHVTGPSITGIELTLQPTVTLRGQLSVENRRGSPAADVSRVRVTAVNVADEALRERIRSGAARDGVSRSASVGPGGTFVLTGLSGGPHYLDVEGIPRGLSLQSATLGASDVLSSYFDVPPPSPDVVFALHLSSQVTTLSGTVTLDAIRRGHGPVKVVAFAVVPPQRRFGSARVRLEPVDNSGYYSAVGLPPGEYFVVAVQGLPSDDDLSAGVLEELTRRAMRVTLRPGDSTVLNLPAVVAR